MTISREWLTYPDLAERLGTAVDAARVLAWAQGWPRRLGPDPRDPVRIGVPRDALAPAGCRASGLEPTADPDESGDGALQATLQEVDALRSTIAALRAERATLNAQLRLLLDRLEAARPAVAAGSAIVPAGHAARDHEDAERRCGELEAEIAAAGGAQVRLYAQLDAARAEAARERERFERIVERLRAFAVRLETMDRERDAEAAHYERRIAELEVALRPWWRRRARRR